MIAVDTNVLVHAHREDSEWHEAAERSLRTLAEGQASWAIPWPCLHEFLAIATHPRIFDPPTPLELALAQVDAWLESPSLVLLAEGAGYWPVLARLVRQGKVVGPKIHDARIAALCLAGHPDAGAALVRTGLPDWPAQPEHLRDAVRTTLLCAKARALGALMRLAADFSGRSAALLKHAKLTCDGDTLELKVTAPYRALVSESVERRLQQAATELNMDYSLTA